MTQKKSTLPPLLIQFPPPPLSRLIKLSFFQINDKSLLFWGHTVGRLHVCPFVPLVHAPPCTTLKRALLKFHWSVEDFTVALPLSIKPM